MNHRSVGYRPTNVTAAVERKLPVGPNAPAQARKLVSEVPLGEDARASVELIISELVTNTVRHGDSTPGGELSVELRREAERVSGRVCGRGPAFSWTDDDPELSEPGGLGLMIVDRMSDRWGITHNSKVCVWFECQDCAPE
jgi:anti-sigma regulatory factor (Ser/Thr protein kinase)